MTPLHDYKPRVDPNGVHSLICIFIQISQKDGVVSICGEPADCISNGASCCLAHYKMMADASVKDMKAYMEQMTKAHTDEDDEAELPSYGIKVPEYLG